ncbi:MAG: serine hydrolase domain-containing protein [Ferruginibacter sp.]
MKKLSFLLKQTFAMIAPFFLSFNAASQLIKAEMEIRDSMQGLNVVGLAVAVVKDNAIIYSNAFGLKDIDKKTPLTTHDIFRIASISKSFSATSIMQLAEKGKVSIHDDFSKLVGFTIRNPRFPATVITLKMVLSHTSSINDSEGYFNLDVITPGKNPGWENCYSDYEPGKGYRYCNLNYNMVGAVIEKISGERFDQYVKHHILDPLALYGGYCIDSLDSSRFTTLYEYDTAAKIFIPSPMAYAPRREEIRNYIMGYSTPIFSPTGGMKISVTDLAKYMMMHMHLGKYNGVKIISKRSAKRMQKKIAEEEGYGLAISNIGNLVPGKIMTGHTGSAYGLYSAMFFHPKEKFGIVVITNGSSPIYTDGINTVLRVMINILYRNFIGSD